MTETISAKEKKKTEKPKYNLWQNSAYMIGLAWRQRCSVLWFCLTMAAVAVLLSLTQLFVAPTILGEIQSTVPLGRLVTTILLFAGGLMLLSAANSYFSSCTRFGRIGVRLYITVMILNKKLTTSFPNTEDQSLKKKQDRASGAVISNDKATEAIWNTLTSLLTNITGFVIYLRMLTAVNPVIMAAVLMTVLLCFFVNRHISGWGYSHRDEEAEYLRRMNYINTKSRDYTLAKDIRIFGMRGWLEDVFESAYRLRSAFVIRGEKYYIWANVLLAIFTFMRSGIIYIYLIGMVLQGELTAAQFLLYFSMAGGFTSWVDGIFSNFNTLHTQSLDISTVREFLEYPEPFRFEAGEPLEPDLNKPYEIELRGVSFRYPGAETDTLKDINLTIKPGEKLAVVGLNGAGKTTLVKLICGFYDPTEGEVLLNGENIKKYNRRDYYRMFSAVFQDFSLLAATVAGNIAQINEGIDMAKAKHCAERAGLTAKINTLPHQFDTYLGKEVYEDGIELSGGEKQRLMLARALYKNAPIIVLDEPTAALDPIAESDMYNKYNELTGGRTSVYISHRLASTRFCNRIILLDHSRISEEGTHDSLIKMGGKYAELFEIQSRYYREGAAENEEEAC